MSFKVSKTVVNAPSRKLKAVWNPNLRKEDGVLNAAKYTIEQALKRTLLQNHGTRVEVYVNEWDAVMEWCQVNCKKHWDVSRDGVLSSPAILKRETAMATGTATQEDMEVLWMNALARQNNQDAAEESGRKIPLIYVWLEDADEAMLFKLTWGGM